MMKHKKELDLVAQELVNKENIDQEEFEKIVGPKPKSEDKEKRSAIKVPKTKDLISS